MPQKSSVAVGSCRSRLGHVRFLLWVLVGMLSIAIATKSHVYDFNIVSSHVSISLARVYPV